MSKVYLAFVGRGHAGLLNGKADPNATPGKESPYIKSLGRKIQEEEFNEPTAKLLIEKLKRSGVHVFNVAPDHHDTPLRSRVDYANKIYWQYCSKYGEKNVVAIYISIHFNAFDGTFAGKNPSGFSVHIYLGQKGKAAGKLGAYILDELKNGTVQVNRGLVEQDLFVLRNTVMPAVLSENGFMDNEFEAEKMIDPAFHEEVATEHAKGACKYFGIPYIETIVKSAELTKEEDVMEQPFKPTVGAINNAVSTVLNRFERKDPALAERWRKEFLNGEMTISDAVGLLYVAIERGYIVGNKVE